MLPGLLVSLSFLFGWEPPPTTPIQEVGHRYAALLQTQAKTTENLSPKELKKKESRASKIAEKMLETYEHLGSLCFEGRKQVCVLPGKESSGSGTASEFGQAQEEMRFIVAMAPGKIATQVLLDNQPLWELYGNGTKLRQFKYPWNGLPGQKTEITKDLWHVYLIRGLDQNIRCNLDQVVRPWVGHEPWYPQVIKELIKGERNSKRRGIVVGEIDHCEVIVLPSEPGGQQWDAFYIDRQHRLTRRITVIAFPEQNNTRLITDTAYYDFRTEPLPVRTFEPNAELLKRSADWQVLSEEEVMADRKPQSKPG